MAGAKITIFLPNGNAQSLRIAELSNWTGKAVAAPRTELEALLARKELTQAGVYFLIGTDPDSGKSAVYIGEGEDVGKRLRQHREKEFWVQVILFVSKDENLTKAHIRFLEGRLIEEAGKVGRYLLINDQASGAKLPEADCEDMEVFLERVRQLLPLLGCDLLVPVVQTAKEKGEGNLLCTIKGLVAHGQRTPQGFAVLKDSEASPVLRPSAQTRAAWIISLRDKLLKTKILTQQGDRLRFAQDYEFSSPSAAAAIIHGGHANGLTAWRTTEGKTLKEIEAAV